jgi:biopolymer transport protein ExbD
MGLKKRSKISAEFSMSSLTDIIFLLLIFFMLTATFVKLQNVELPKSDSKAVASTSVAVTIDKAGKYYLNGTPIPKSAVEREVRKAISKADNKENATLTIVAELGVPFENVSSMMAIASKLKIKAILATSPRQG